MIHIVLVHPKMPSNTGNIIRLCANTGASLHLLKPLGFDLDDKKLRRAGLDYHEYANLKVYDDWQSLKDSLDSLDAGCEHIVALTTKFSKPFYEYDFTKNNDKSSSQQDSNSHVKDNTQPNATQNVALVFGSETDGLPENIRKDIGSDNWLRLPMLPNSRSLNLSNSVAICLYEVWRQLGFYGDTGSSVGYETMNSV